MNGDDLIKMFGKPAVDVVKCRIQRFHDEGVKFKCCLVDIAGDGKSMAILWKCKEEGCMYDDDKTTFLYEDFVEHLRLVHKK